MTEEDKFTGEQESRRSFMKKAIYVPPTILTLQAAPAYAKYGSENPAKGNEHEDKEDKKTDKDEKVKNKNKKDD